MKFSAACSLAFLASASAFAPAPVASVSKRNRVDERTNGDALCLCVCLCLCVLSRAIASFSRISIQIDARTVRKSRVLCVLDDSKVAA